MYEFVFALIAVLALVQLLTYLSTYFRMLRLERELLSERERCACIAETEVNPMVIAEKIRAGK